MRAEFWKANKDRLLALQMEGIALPTGETDSKPFCLFEFGDSFFRQEPGPSIADSSLEECTEFLARFHTGGFKDFVDENLEKFVAKRPLAVVP